MTKYKDLFVGDMHSQVSNLSDTERLLEFILEKVREHSPKRLIFLGDLFHTHSVVRQEVIHLYRKYMKIYAALCKVVILSGNHDGISPSNAQTNICEAVFGEIPNVTVVSGATSDDDYVYVAFMHDNDRFVNVANGFSNTPDKILVCHQTFNGAAYENGMPIPGGVDAKTLSAPLVLSGHIHAGQQVGKVTYLGTPRMVTRAEANMTKYIYYLEGESPSSLTYTAHSTNPIVKQYLSLSYKEEDGLKTIDLSATHVKSGDEVTVTVEGSEEFYNAFVKQNESSIGTVRFIPKIVKKLEGRVSIEQSGDIKSAMKKYVLEVADIRDDLREKVWQKVSNLI